MSFTKLFRCPLCAWSYAVPENAVPSGALAAVFGAGVLRSIRSQQLDDETEAALAAHFRTHTTAQFLTRICALESLVGRVTLALTEKLPIDDALRQQLLDEVRRATIVRPPASPL